MIPIPQHLTVILEKFIKTVKQNDYWPNVKK